MDKMMDSPWVLRITALGLAILLFFSVRSDLDTTKRIAVNEQEDIIRDVPVEVYYDTDNLIVTGVPQTVDVRVSGPLQLVLPLRATKDFKVFVDLNQLVLGKHKVKLQYENISDKIDVAIEPRSIDIEIEEKVTKEFRVDPEMNRGNIADGYVLKDMKVNPATVYVTGAKSVIDSISYVKATIDGDSTIKGAFSQEASVRVLDRDLNKLDVTVKPEKVKVDVDVGEYSQEIPIKISQTGNVKAGLEVVNVSAEQQSVTVYGSKSIVDVMESIDVPLDLGKVTESKTYTITIPKPEGVKKLSEDTIKVKVEVRQTAIETPIDPKPNETPNVENEAQQDNKEEKPVEEEDAKETTEQPESTETKE
ncbi:hypothetical protein GCM10007425_21520 [Lysinibacillus alkalisoli]|uniref:YbbR-like domain-containing protein n=1 Tax=Lysinibacillus alkalisoli TaxID=1911548 RepID=A0A917G7I3_9BACI|nr:CdaR family protein [Lysinibacillus alkalisoli]GGG26622.1 hypothetical protein GCM10007425_21520 [Lysinibacillus alkalisoli]